MGFTIENDVLLRYEEEPGVTEILIPYGVREIGKNAFAQCRHLTEIIIPQSVTSIGESAFKSCYGLRRILLPEGITEIKDSTFAWCEGLEEVFIPEHVRVIGHGAFGGCKQLQSVQLPKRLLKIEDSAFEDCMSLRRMVVPKGVTHVGRRACNAVEAIEVAKGNKHYAALDGVLYDRKYGTLLQCPIGRQKLTVPETVTTIMNDAFYGCKKLTEVILPERLKKIRFWAFSRCEKLTEITIPAQVSEIEDNPFMGCYALKEVHVAHGNQHFAIRDGVLYSGAYTHIVHFPFDRKHVVLAGTVTQFPKGLSSGICESVEYMGAVFTCDKGNMRAMLDGLVNRNFDYFSTQLPEPVRYETLWKLYRTDPVRWEATRAGIQAQLGAMLRWLIDQGEQTWLEEILTDGSFKLREEIGALVQYANEQQQFDIQLLLMDYKNEHIGYDRNQFKL